MPDKHVRRGEIYYYNFGSQRGAVQAGIRPAMVIQSDAANKKSNTTVIAAITTNIRRPYLPNHINLGKAFGLKKPSMLLLEQVRTVNQVDLLDYIGCVDDAQTQRAITFGQAKLFGLR